MVRRLEYADDFSRDLRTQLRFLARRGEWDWIVRLQADLSEAEELLGTFPEVGGELAREGSEKLRKLRLRRAPYYVWYTLNTRSLNAPVRLLRLFHVRQKATRPRT